MVCCEDIETQQKGSVVVMYAVDAKDDIRWLDYNLLQSTMAVMESLPLRTEAFHICHNNHWTWAPKVALYKLIAPIFSSLRSRAHYGKPYASLSLYLAKIHRISLTLFCWSSRIEM